MASYGEACTHLCCTPLPRSCSDPGPLDGLGEVFVFSPCNSLSLKPLQDPTPSLRKSIANGEARAEQRYGKDRLC